MSITDRDPEMREYYKLVFPSSVCVGDTLAVLRWYPERTVPKYRPGQWRRIVVTVTSIKRFGSSYIVAYSFSLPKGEGRGSTLFYPTQYAWRVLTFCRTQPSPCECAI